MHPLAADKKVIIFGVPGAFTPTCSLKDVSDSLKRKKVLSRQDAPEILSDAVSRTEAFMNHHYEGCTATVLLVWTNGHENFYAQCANVGDSACVMDVDGQCISQPPYFSSEYLQQPVPYETEAVPCYSWDSTYVGDATNGTNANFGNVKSGSRPTASAKANDFPSMKAKGTVANKFSLPFDSKSRQFAAPSNFPKSIFQSQPLKPLNKGFRLGSDFPAVFCIILL